MSKIIGVIGQPLHINANIIATGPAGKDGVDGEVTQAQLDAVETKLTTHLAENASKHIKESGSNTNGRYIKFDDGTAIAYTSKVITIEEIGTKDYSYVFPITFSAIASVEVLATTRTSSWTTDVSRITRATPSAVTTYIVSVSSTRAGISVTASIFAIGRWKA